MTPNCLGITCCIDVEVELPLMKQPIEYYIPFHLIFSPCDNMKIDIAFGSYTREEQLLNYEFGKELDIGTFQGLLGNSSPSSKKDISNVLSSLIIHIE